MPTFPFSWTFISSSLTRDAVNRQHYKLKLNEKWTILFFISRSFNTLPILNSIEIRRENTEELFLVSGKLAFKRYLRMYFDYEFSELIGIGSSFIQLSTSFAGGIQQDDVLFGYVNISYINEKLPSTFLNKDSRDVIHLQSLEKLSKDFQQILDLSSSYFADVTLKCGSVSIPAHKYILSARSPVFSAMFATPMKESRENEVDITDVHESTLRAVLMYMYTGKTSDLTVTSAADLLFAADKYQLQELKTLCSYFLKDEISSENMWIILELGDKHAENLKSFAMNYICNMFDEFAVLEKTQEWIFLRREKLDLAMALLEYFVRRKENRKLKDKN